jgi:type VI secretion system secreted protein VgrG
MVNFKQSDRLMRFSSQLGKDVLLLERFWGVESVSRLFDFQAELLATVDTEVDPKAIVGTKVTIAIDLNNTVGTRYVYGIVAAFEQGGGDSDFNVFRAHIVPSLWQLTLSTDCRVFQGKSVMDIVKEVISTYGLSVQDKTTKGYKPLDYCTQYQETDFNFISRILEQHGIFYWFQHTENDNEVYFADSRDVYADCADASDLDYSPQGSGEEGAYGASVDDFSSIASMVSGKHTYWDYDFRSFGDGARKIGSKSSASPFGKNGYERYSYPAGEQGYNKKTDTAQSDTDYGTGFVGAQGDASDATALVYHGSSNARFLCAGYTFTLASHPHKDWNRKYLLTEVVHHADQVPSYRSTSNSGGGYSNQFKAIASDIVYRAPALTPKPLIHGPQTALVVAGAGEEIEVDKLGRVNLQLFWDRKREKDQVDSTWVRVAQPWAGKGWGAFFWPRAGHEVVVEFIDGDPDSPLVVGSLYNGTNATPYTLPDFKTRSGVKAHSSIGGGAAGNELRFEDKIGAEQIYLYARYDMDQRVKNDLRVVVEEKESRIVGGDQLTSIQGQQSTTIKSNKVESVSGAASLTVGGNRNEKVGQNYSLNVGSNFAEKVGSNYAMDAGTELYLKAGTSLVIESGMNLCLKGAGGFITIGPSGIAIQGMLVMINSGGAAVPGTPGVLTDPASTTAPDQADDGSKGTKI